MKTNNEISNREKMKVDPFGVIAEIAFGMVEVLVYLWILASLAAAIVLKLSGL